MEQLAEDVLAELRESIGGEPIEGVSYFDADEVGHVYLESRERGAAEEARVDRIVEDLQLEVIGYGAYEKRQQEQLHATSRIYDDLLDVTVPVNGDEGVAVALDIDGEYSVRNVVDRIERVVADSHVVEREPLYRS